MNVMGFSEVLRRLPRIFGNLKKAKRLLDAFRPDVLVLVDYPGFNLKLARYAHRRGIRADYYISPKVWAWKEWRVKKIKKHVSSMYSILPFEVAFYARHGYKAVYVGNPSVQEMDYALGHLPPVKHFIERQGLGGDDRPLIALLPGSRKGEIRNNLPLMIEAAKRFPEFRYVVAAAPAVPERFYRETAQDPGLPVVFGCTPTLLKYSRCRRLLLPAPPRLRSAFGRDAAGGVLPCQRKEAFLQDNGKAAESEVCVAAQPDSGQSGGPGASCA